MIGYLQIKIFSEVCTLFDGLEKDPVLFLEGVHIEIPAYVLTNVKYILPKCGLYGG